MQGITNGTVSGRTASGEMRHLRWSGTEAVVLCLRHREPSWLRRWRPHTANTERRKYIISNERNERLKKTCRRKGIEGGAAGTVQRDEYKR